MDLSLRTPRRLISSETALFWALINLGETTGPFGGVRKGDLSFMSVGIGIAAEVFSLFVAIEVVKGLLTIGGKPVVIVLVTAEVDAWWYRPSSNVVGELVDTIAGITPSCSRLLISTIWAIRVASTHGAGIRSVCPIFKLYQSTSGLKASTWAKVMLLAAAIMSPVSPTTMVYTRAPVLSSSQGMLSTWPICRFFHETVGFMKASCMNSILRRCAMPLPVSPA